MIMSTFVGFFLDKRRNRFRAVQELSHSLVHHFLCRLRVLEYLGTHHEISAHRRNTSKILFSERLKSLGYPQLTCFIPYSWRNSVICQNSFYAIHNLKCIKNFLSGNVNILHQRTWFASAFLLHDLNMNMETL